MSGEPCAAPGCWVRADRCPVHDNRAMASGERGAADHPAVAQVLALYRAAIRDGDTPEDLAARYVAATCRVLARDVFRVALCAEDATALDDLADEIEETIHA